MAKVIEDLSGKNKLVNIIESMRPKRVIIVFWHGLGDLIMFTDIFFAIKDRYPDIHFDIALQENVGQEEIFPDAILINGGTKYEDLDYDLVAKIGFHMSEHQDRYTKSEWSCIHEIGISPIYGHNIVSCPTDNPIVAVHFQGTCIPGCSNPDDDVCEKIWQEILDASKIPIECLFEHCYHNPVNKRFDFITSHVRGIQPSISKLAGLIKHSFAFIGVVSGNFHVALSVLSPSRIMLLEKDWTSPMFTREKIARCNVKQYVPCTVYDWLKSLSNSS